MPWIEVHQSIANHPKRKRLSRALGISVAEAVGLVILLHHWAIDYAPDGDLAGCDAADIADGVANIKTMVAIAHSVASGKSVEVESAKGAL